MVNYNTIIAAALVNLAEAENRLRQPVYPSVPAIRPKKYVWLKNLAEWTFCESGYTTIKIQGFVEAYYTQRGAAHLADKLLRHCKHQPAKVLHLLKRIEASTEWCNKRIEGKKRASEEILKQQKRAAEFLEVKAGLIALAGLGNKVS